ncbi:MAG: beta-mannosidase [Brevinematia bacterium]
MKEIILSDSWHLKRIATGEIFDTKLPSSVIHTLWLNGKIDHPYYRDNQDRVILLLEEDFEFYTEFEVNDDIMNEDRIYLAFQVDTIASVYLNEILISQTKNMHRLYEVDVKNILKKGKNTLRIHITSPLPYIREREKILPLFGVKEAISGYPHLRKAHYMFGWDWGMQLPDMGIYTPPFLKCYSVARIKNVNFSQTHYGNTVNLKFEVEIEKFVSKDLVLSLMITSPSGAEFPYETEVKDNLCFIEIEIDNPFLWWPTGYGKQYLYNLEIRLSDGNKMIDIFEKKFGLRKVELVREKDKIGESFYFRINGVDIFIKGANYIPEDHIIPLINEKRSRRLLSDCIKANFNTLRVWGGGFYPSDWFYEMCDELGLLVWQDFMFACSQYPPYRDFIDEIKKEVIYNLNRLKFHPSIILWCGNNEIEEAFVYWGIPQNKVLRKTYIKIFEKIIPSIVKRFDPDRPYWPSSPSTKGGFYEPRKETAGDSHYWAVWHWLKPFEDYREHNFRFVSEFGFQSFPSIKTIESFTEKEDRNIFSYVMEKHQKNQAANGKIIYYLSENYLFPKNFKSLIYLSQLLQAEAIKFGVKHFRIKRGICMGSIYWQLNDCWPVASWSSVDYYGRWKALHYFAKKFYSPVILASDRDEKSIKIYLVNDTSDEKEYKLSYRLANFDGEEIASGIQDIRSKALSSTNVFDFHYISFLNTYDDLRRCYFDFSLIDEEGNEIYREFEFFVRPKHFIWLPPEIKLDFGENENYFYIYITSNRFAKNVEVDFEGFDIILSDNYFDLPASEKKGISFNKEEYSELSLEDIKKNIRVLHLYDTFV